MSKQETIERVKLLVIKCLVEFYRIKHTPKGREQETFGYFSAVETLKMSCIALDGRNKQVIKIIEKFINEENLNDNQVLSLYNDYIRLVTEVQEIKNVKFSKDSGIEPGQFLNEQAEKIKKIRNEFDVKIKFLVDTFFN